MDLKKTGVLLKELRKESNMTQEQLAEKLNVSGRTVSRWETGSNMPDLDILIELADLYEVDIRELIDGERKSENMDKETKDTLKKVADYADAEKKRLAKKMCDMTAGAAILLMAFIVMRELGLVDTTSSYKNLADFILGGTLAVLVLDVLYCSGILDKIRAKKIAICNKKNGSN